MYLNNIVLSVLGLLSLAVAAPIQEVRDTSSTKNVTSYENSVYFSNAAMYANDYKPADLPASQLTIINYAFAIFDLNGTVYSSDHYSDTQKLFANDSGVDIGTNAYGNVKQLYQLKKDNRHLRVVLSIGGTSTTDFGAVAATKDTRATFARTAVELVNDWGFDGINIDWEYPTCDEDKANFVLLVQALRDQFDTYAAQYAPGYHFLLSIASYAGEGHYQYLDFPALSKVLDFYNLMAYDYSGSWSDYSAHQANLFNNEDDVDSTPYFTDAAIKAYVEAGVPTSQILLGMPVYGRSFTSTSGLGKSYGDIGNNSIAYNELPKPGAKVSMDKTTVAAFSYDPLTGEFITFDTPAVVHSKSAYIQSENLGGAVFWEVSLDKADEDSLVGAAYSVLGRNETTTQNLLHYPQSRYANIAAGLP